MDLQSRGNSSKAASRECIDTEASSANFLLPRAVGFSGGAFDLTLTFTTGPVDPDELEVPGSSTTSEKPALFDCVGAGMTGVKLYSPAEARMFTGVLQQSVAFGQGEGVRT